MATQADIQFARIILKKGWLPKETLETALKEVAAIRAHDPEMTLAHYLGVKELLDWEKVEWARDLIEGGGEAAQAPEAPAKTAHPPEKSRTVHKPPGARDRRSDTWSWAWAWARATRSAPP
jgi:hypothetical protein